LACAPGGSAPPRGQANRDFLILKTLRLCGFARENSCGCREKHFGLNKSGDFRSVTADMNSELEIVFAEDPPAVVLGELEVATVCGDELWKEDKTRSGNWALNACLAILRVALISLKFRNGVTCSWPRVFERTAA
jgi:hypothetical protein